MCLSLYLSFQQVCTLSTTNGPENNLARNAITVYTALQYHPKKETQFRIQSEAKMYPIPGYTPSQRTDRILGMADSGRVLVYETSSLIAHLKKNQLVWIYWVPDWNNEQKDDITTIEAWPYSSECVCGVICGVCVWCDVCVCVCDVCVWCDVCVCMCVHGVCMCVCMVCACVCVCVCMCV